MDLGRVVVTTDPLRRELEGLVARALASGAPFPAASARVFDHCHPSALYEAFCRTGLHDRAVCLPPEDESRVTAAASRARRFQRLRGLLSLGWVAQQRARRGSRHTRPSPAWFLHVLRRQWHRLLSELPEDTARRVSHVIQVQLTPADVRELMLGAFAITFSTAGRSAVVPDEPVPLPLARAQWLYLDRTPLGRLSSRLGVGRVEFDRQTWGPVVRPGREYAFGHLPGQRSRRESNQDLFDQPVTVENALACHAALEAAAVTGQNVLTTPRLPDILAAAKDPLQFGDPDLTKPTEAFLRVVVGRFNDWWRFARDGEGARRATAEQQSRRPFPFAWVDVLEEADDRLSGPAVSWDVAAHQLGGLAETFLWGVWLSEWRTFGTRAVIPVEFVPPSFGDPFKNAEAFVYFPPALRGRPAYRGDVIQIDYTASIAQVIKPSTGPGSEQESAY